MRASCSWLDPSATSLPAALGLVIVSTRSLKAASDRRGHEDGDANGTEEGGGGGDSDGDGGDKVGGCTGEQSSTRRTEVSTLDAGAVEGGMDG